MKKEPKQLSSSQTWTPAVVGWLLLLLLFGLLFLSAPRWVDDMLKKRFPQMRFMEHTLLALGLSVVLPLALFFFLRQVRRRGRTAALGDPVRALSSPPYATDSTGAGPPATLEEAPFELKQIPASRDRPPCLEICLPIPFPCRLALRRETLLDRLGKVSGLAQEIQTGDRDFDNLVYVECEQRKFGAAFLASKERRKAARWLLCEVPRFQYVQGDRDGVTLRVEQEVDAKARLIQSLTPALLEATVAHLRRFAAALPEVALTRERFNAWEPLKYVAMTIFLTGLVAFLLGMSDKPLDGCQFDYSLRWSLPVFLAWTVLSFLLLRGRSTALGEFFVVTLFSFIGLVVFGGVGGTICVNRYCDTSRPVKHLVKVERMWIQHGYKGGPSSYVAFASWRQRGEEKVVLEKALYATLHPGSQCLVVTRTGRLGFEWVSSIDRVEPTAVPAKLSPEQP